MLEVLDGEQVRLWTLASTSVRGSDGSPFCLVGPLTLADDFVIIGDCNSLFWTAIPLREIAILELAVAEDSDADEEQETEEQVREARYDEFEQFYQKLAEKRRHREP